MNQLRCYIYTRVSTSMQVDGYSLDAQKEKLRKYADFQNMKIVGEFSDEGKSGKSIQGRSEFLQMISNIEEGKDHVDFVLVFKLSRFGRNAADVLNSLQNMQDYGTNLICVEDGIDSSKDSGKLMISVLSAVAEIERENILIQTMEGRKQKAREGKWNGGFAPYGYQLINGELVIAEDEVEIIKIIFDKFINTTKGINGVTDFLNTHGYKKKTRQNNTLKTFTQTFIRGVIDNPIYCGKIAFGRRKTEKVRGKRDEYKVVKSDDYLLNEGIHEAIISESDWHLAQSKRQQQIKRNTKSFSSSNNPHEHLLSSILKCPTCGSNLYGNVNRKKDKNGEICKEYFYYACKHRSTIYGKKCDYRKQWEENKVNDAVAQIISNLVNNSKFEEAIKAKINTSIDTTELDNNYKQLMKNLNQLMTNKKKLGQQIDSLDIEDRFYERKYQDLQDRLATMYETIEEVENSIDEITARIDNVKQEKITGDNIYQFLLYFDRLYDKFTPSEKKEFLKSFIEYVKLFPVEQPDGRFLKSIKFKFPVYFNGRDIDEINWDNENIVETVSVLSKLLPQN